MLLRLGKKIENIVAKFTLVSFICTLAIMLLNVADVFMSKVFSRSIMGAYEVTQLLMLCAVIGSYAYGQTMKKHINMGLLVSRFPYGLRYVVTGILGLASVVITVIIAIAAFQQSGVAMSKNTVTGTLFIPWWPFYIIEGICMLIFAIVLLYDTIMTFAALGGNKEIREYVESKWS